MIGIGFSWFQNYLDCSYQWFDVNSSDIYIAAYRSMMNIWKLI